MKTLQEMTNAEKSLLLYAESCAVDNGGLIRSQRINTEDVEIFKRWNKEGFILYDRLTWDSVQQLKDHHNAHRVKLSDYAWKLAHEERRARHKRMCLREPYCNIVTTKEKREAQKDNQ